MAPGRALVVVAVKKLARLEIASFGEDLGAVNIARLDAPAIPIHRQLMHYVHVHDPMHVSVFVHVFSCSLHSFIGLLLVFYYVM